MSDKQDLIREIQEYVAAHGGENTTTHLLVQAAAAISEQAAELEAVGAGGLQPLRAAPTPPAEQQAAPNAAPGEPDGFGSAEHWKEKAQYWAGVAHRLRGEALRGEPVDGIVHPPAPRQEAQEPVAWQSRTRPTWGGNTRPWSPWEPCTKGQAEDCWKTPLLHDWAYEARALFTSPQPAPAELERLRERISKMGLDVDRAMRGHVNEQSPLGTTRLAAIAALAKPAPAPLSEQDVLGGLMATPNSVLENCADAFEAGVRFAEHAHSITQKGGQHGAE